MYYNYYFPPMHCFNHPAKFYMCWTVRLTPLKLCTVISASNSFASLSIKISLVERFNNSQECLMLKYDIQSIYLNNVETKYTLYEKKYQNC